MNLLLESLRNPSSLERLSISDWDRLVRMARRDKLMGYLFYIVHDADLATACPTPALDMLTAGRRYADFLQTRAKYAIRAILRALEPERFPLVLLKGAAYTAAELPNARGRMLSDVDILVRREDLDLIEHRLLSQDWKHQKLDSYDQRYYREWMHEIPPLRHPEHGIEVDIHHALLPLTARVRPDPELLWDASLPLGDGRLRVLAPSDMILHTAAHLFYDGEITGGLRDLVDLQVFFRHFGQDPEFWDALPQRAEALHLTRPLFYALRYCSRLLATEIPPEADRYSERKWAPAFPAQKLMDGLVRRALQPRIPEEPSTPVSVWLLYVRSHWLRMPPWLLAQHLSRKAWRRMKPTQPAPA